MVSDTQGNRDWKALAEHMAGHVREFEKQGRLPAGVACPPEEQADIAGLLQVLIP